MLALESRTIYAEELLENGLCFGSERVEAPEGWQWASATLSAWWLFARRAPGGAIQVSCGFGEISDEDVEVRVHIYKSGHCERSGADIQLMWFG